MGAWLICVGSSFFLLFSVPCPLEAVWVWRRHGDTKTRRFKLQPAVWAALQLVRVLRVIVRLAANIGRWLSFGRIEGGRG